MAFRRTFRRVRGGGVKVSLHEREIELLAGLAGDLRTVVSAPSGDDPVSSRLFPRAYLDPTEEQAEQDWESAVHDDLVAGRLAALDAVTETLQAARAGSDGYVSIVLDEEGEARWLGVLNDARLTIGTIAEVSEDEEDFADLDPTDPRAELLAIYAWLTQLQGQLVEVMLGALPD